MYREKDPAFESVSEDCQPMPVPFPEICGSSSSSGNSGRDNSGSSDSSSSTGGNVNSSDVSKGLKKPLAAVASTTAVAVAVAGLSESNRQKILQQEIDSLRKLHEAFLRIP